MTEALPNLRHSARGSFNALKLCATALALTCSPAEQVEFLEDIIQASDKVCEVLEELARNLSIHPYRGPTPP